MPTPVVQANMFASPNELGMSDKPEHNKYALMAGYRECIKRALDAFGISLFHLGKLLGLPDAHDVYKWTSPSKRTQRRPASKYMMRLAALYDLHVKGIPLIALDGIDWSTGQAYTRSSTVVEVTRNSEARYVPRNRGGRISGQSNGA